MFLTQPPITTAILGMRLIVEDDHFRSFVDTATCVVVRDHSGLTLGPLHDTMLATFESECRNSMASGRIKAICFAFNFASTCENVGQQCLQTISDQ